MSGTKGMKGTKPRTLGKLRVRTWLQDVDGKSALAIALKRRKQMHVDDGGGEDNLSVKEISLIERGVFIEARIAELESLYARGKGFNHTEHLALVTSLGSIYRTLGMKRAAKTVTALDYAAAVAARESEP